MKNSLVKSSSYRAGRIVGSRIKFLVVNAFADEGRAVLAGNERHFREEQDKKSRMFLRRSVHRIEKGLVSKPRKPSFAGDYIQDAVGTYENLVHGDTNDVGELNWAKDVLFRFFDATAASDDPRVLAARETWEAVILFDKNESALSPFPQSILQDNGRLLESLDTVASHRRSIRWFNDREVPRDVIDRAIGVGLTAPSACNRQSFRIAVVTDPDLRAKVARIPMGTAGFAHQIPAIAVIVGQHRGYEHYRDRHAIYVDGGLFSTGFILALEAAGLNTCCINWPELPEKERELRNHISLETDERPIMFIAIGYGIDGQLVPRSHKRSVEAVRQWI